MMRSQAASLPGCVAGLFLLVMLPGAIAAGGDEPPGGRPASPARPAGPGPAAGDRARLDRCGDPLPPGVLARFGTVRHRQETPIGQIVYSPDGRLVATDGDDAEIRIWDGRDGRLIRRIDVGEAVMRVPAFSPDSRTLAVARYRLDRDRLGYVVDVTYAEAASGTQIVRGPWPEQDSVSALALSPDLGLLATATTGGTLRLRDAQDGREAGRFLVDRREIRRIAFALRGRRLAVLSYDEGNRGRERRVDLFDVRRKEAERVIPDLKEKDMVRVIPDLDAGARIALSPEGDLVCICDRYQIDCRDAGTGQPARIGHLWGEDAAFSAIGRQVFTFQWPKVTVTDVPTGQTVGSLEVGGSRPTAWAVSPDGATVATSGGPTALHFWDVSTGRDRLAIEDAHSEPVQCLLFSPDGRVVITGSDDRTVRLWDAASGAQRKVLQLAGRPRTLTVSPDGRRLIVGAEDNGWVFTWDLDGGPKPVILLDRFNEPGYPLDVRYSAADRKILAAWSDGRVLEAQGQGGKLKERKPAKFIEEPALELSVANRFRSGISFAGGTRIGAIGRDRGLKVADIGAGRQVWEYAEATIVAASPDQKTLAVALQAEDPYYQKESFLIVGPDRFSTPRRLRVGPDRPGATIVLLDGAAGKERLRIPIPEAIVWGLAFSPDGKTLAVTCGRDGARGRIRLLPVANGGVARVISTPAISGPGLSFSPDGSRLAVAMADTSVLLWDLRPGP